MDLMDICNLVKQNSNDIISEVLFQDWFGVSPSYELTLPKTNRQTAIDMMKHAGFFTEWQSEIGTLFECRHFEIGGLDHHLSVVIFNHHQPCGYRVTLRFLRLTKYNKYGDNLVKLLLGMMKDYMRGGENAD